MNATSAKDYLAEYDAAPEEQKFPLVYQWMKKEPLPFFKQLREQRPILVTPACTLVARWDDVTDILDMPSVFTVDLYKPKMGNNYLMCFDDGVCPHQTEASLPPPPTPTSDVSLHYREKSIMQGLLNKDDLPAVRKLIADAGKRILDEADGKIEACYGYCRTVPSILVQDYFGLTDSNRDDLIRWSYWSQYNTFHNQPFEIHDPDPEKSAQKSREITATHGETTKELVAYIKKLIIRRTFIVKAKKITGLYLLENLWRKLGGQGDSGLRDDITTRMLRAGYPDTMDFGLKRRAANAGGLLIGSIETTEQAVAQVIQYFLDDPDLLQRARAEAQKEDTQSFDALVWEALRFVPISPYFFRKTSRDYTLGKGADHATTIPKDTIVLPLTQSAMFDERAYEDPETFNPNRDGYHNFNFGFGLHDCLGKYVGGEMIPEMVRQVMRRKNLQAEGKIDYKGGPFPEHWVLRYAG